MEKAAKKPGLLAAFLIAVAGLVCTLFYPLLFIAGGLFGYLLIAGGPMLFLLSAALCAAGAYVLGGIPGLWLLGLMLSAALCLNVMLRRKASYFNTAFTLSGLFLLALYLMFNLADILAGSPPFYTLQQGLSEFWAQGATTWAQMSGLEADQLKKVLELGRYFFAQFPVYMTAFLCGAGALLGLSNLLLCVRLCRRAAAPIKPMHPFGLWQLPQSFLYGMLTMGAGVLIAPAMGVSAMDAVAAAVYMIALLPFAVQGLSVMWFMHKARQASDDAFTIVIMVLVVFLSVLLLGVVGLLEQLFHFRRKYLQRGNQQD